MSCRSTFPHARGRCSETGHDREILGARSSVPLSSLFQPLYPHLPLMPQPRCWPSRYRYPNPIRLRVWVKNWGSGHLTGILPGSQWTGLQPSWYGAHRGEGAVIDDPIAPTFPGLGTDPWVNCEGAASCPSCRWGTGFFQVRTTLQQVRGSA